MIPPDQRDAETTGSVGRLRVVVAAADPAQRRAVRDALAGSRRIVVVADARDEVETLELTRWYRPDVVLVDLALPPHGAVVAKILAAAPCAVVVLAADRDDGPAGLRSLRAGARGFVSLPHDADTLAASLRAVADGEVAISPRLVMALVVGLRALPDPHGLRPVRSALTDREWEVLDLLRAGASTKEIADALLVTRDTVYGHVKRILRKLGVRTRQEAVTAAGALRASSRA
jgi:DNA-binding NarL/FixJ family response regulator